MMILMNGTGQRLIFKELQAASFKLDSWYGIILYTNRKKKYMDTAQLKRIADAIEEILRLVKKDMEPRDKNKK